MKFEQRGSRFLSGDYQLIHSIRGWQVWRLVGPSYNILERDIPTLAAAKELAESHQMERAKEVYLS